MSFCSVLYRSSSRYYLFLSAAILYKARSMAFTSVMRMMRESFAFVISGAAFSILASDCSWTNPVYDAIMGIKMGFSWSLVRPSGSLYFSIFCLYLASMSFSSGTMDTSKE